MVPGNFYHIYNHANGSENLFIEERNYFFFLEKIYIYIFPFVNLHAYCLLPNHFHLLISTKDLDEIKLLESFKAFRKLPDEVLQPIMEKKISKSFSNLFSSYTQAFNKVYARKGSLFMPNMKADVISDNAGICNITHYIHANPIHHGFVADIRDWKFSSYNAYGSRSVTKLSKDLIIDIFGSMNNFIACHKQPIKVKSKWEM
jgi:putative transposase